METSAAWEKAPEPKYSNVSGSWISFKAKQEPNA